MKHKTKILVDRFTGILSSWKGVECITLNEAALSDTLDPYFALILDVFCSDKIPDADERFVQYGDDVAAFESSGLNEKDRFLIGDIPVRLEYKSVEKIEHIVDIAVNKNESLWLIKDSGTYSFYRLANSEIIFARTDWMHKIKKELENIGDDFWEEMRNIAQSRMEHFLSDLGAACFQNDKFHYLIASAGFIKNACLTLFCINKRFEPSHRAYYKQVCELNALPVSFITEFETFLDNSHDVELDSKFYIAKRIALKIISSDIITENI
ncbi:MAG: DUF4037 domain-containing protein [Treponema sp.]|jgi:hypothetical protein|nr:DUF4037 domain-containing protein [Treponema sp.]